VNTLKDAMSLAGEWFFMSKKYRDNRLNTNPSAKHFGINNFIEGEKTFHIVTQNNFFKI
jgi:NAD-dependent SIR2 family protein deacetylase